MKFLQINNIPKPKILEMGVDFNLIMIDYIAHADNFTIEDNFLNCRYSAYCKLSDCHQSQPLFEIDGFCEFDVCEYIDDRTGLFLLAKSNAFYVFHLSNKKLVASLLSVKGNKRGDKHTNKGSIFTPENKEKYPELYSEALKITQL
jgi:hypothetical protein